MPQNRKGRGKASARPLAVPNLENKPRYETPDPCQLPTPKDTPRVELPTILKERSGSKLNGSSLMTRKRQVVVEEEEEDEEKEASSSSEEETYGQWVVKGNPMGFLDTDDEAEIDGWGREERKRRFNSMNLDEWKTIGLFLLKHIVNLVGGEGAPEGTDFRFVEAILREDGSVEFKGRDNISLETILEDEIAILKHQVKACSTKGSAEKELIEARMMQRDAYRMCSEARRECEEVKQELKEVTLEKKRLVDRDEMVG
ncbi:hypothetical protein BGX38DRAFT_1266492 [Terfezia claveryi]|nr:hypothetical protein BGX38DRAFT_1266492 [Terfezia claveryi]